MQKTKDNLQAALAGESQANRKYLAFAEKALKEGKPGVAKLFRSAAASETIHAYKYLESLREIKSTKENLQTAISGENYESQNMYPEFAKDAEKEGESGMQKYFEWVAEVEKGHARMYQEAMEKISADEDIEEKDYYICKACGFTTPDEAPETCPVCGAPKNMFEKVE